MKNTLSQSVMEDWLNYYYMLLIRSSENGLINIRFKI